MHTSQLYTQNTLAKKYAKSYNSKTQSQNKTNYGSDKNHGSTETKNQLELRHESINDGTVATSETFDSKLFYNTAPR